MVLVATYRCGRDAAVERSPPFARDHSAPVVGTVPAAAVDLDRALPDARRRGLYSKPRLLTNAQMAEFLAQGFLSLPVDDVVSHPGVLVYI